MFMESNAALIGELAAAFGPIWVCVWGGGWSRKKEIGSDERRRERFADFWKSNVSRFLIPESCVCVFAASV